MIKTLNPYNTATTAKTAEIMSRYRPIAPKPEVPASPMSESPKIGQSPYLRNLWPQLQARPTRTRKRGRTAISPPAIKRSRTHIFGLSPPCHVTSPAKNLSLQGFSHGVPQLTPPNLAAVSTSMENPATATSNLVTLPLLPCTPSVPAVSNKKTVPEMSNCMETFGGVQAIDLNKVAEIPEEKDLLVQLQRPPSTKIIAPHPVRPVGSSIRVECINEDQTLIPGGHVPKKKPEEVEEEVESEALPAVISDSSNKVRMANSAYREMVGQPECSWLDSMMSSSCKRICGEVMLRFPDSEVPVSSNRFSCWVRIEWGRDGQKNSVHAFCDAIRLCCESKDYLFIWRFHPHAREVSQSSCDV
ncbi:Seed dormancy protein [Melia azedarach]|uniref:Seed dormancy protein n=1 Tax=Melia azedarach TaxID=155640 RepID=A0ACC1WQX2_MELAZ|nr:Seed dormancy protein [Melia azedarach]